MLAAIVKAVPKRREPKDSIGHCSAESLRCMLGRKGRSESSDRFHFQYLALGRCMAPTNNRPIKLLIVDDDDDLRQDLAQLFRKQGHEVTAAVSGEDALDKAAHARFDVALLDLHLPGISGIDLLAQLKEQQPELEALMLTAHSSIESAVEAMRKGAYDYLTKPFRTADLEVHVQKAFEKVQLQRREQQWLQQLSYESPRYRLVGSSPADNVAIHKRVAGAIVVRGAAAALSQRLFGHALRDRRCGMV